VVKEQNLENTLKKMTYAKTQLIGKLNLQRYLKVLVASKYSQKVLVSHFRGKTTVLIRYPYHKKK